MGVFDDPTAPDHILTTELDKYLKNKYPEKLTLDDIKVLNEDLKTKTLALDPNDNSLSKFQKSQSKRNYNALKFDVFPEKYIF